METKVRVGDTRVGFTMEPLRADGQYVCGGNHYANADTIEAARDYARRVVGTQIGAYCRCRETVAAVLIVGKTWVFTGAGWKHLHGTPVTRETVTA